ncbi:MAG: Glu-tRNA(Gln) amidotransferase subunit GatD [Candidatus Methanomethylicia archaeon]|nr:Glu-tRNA(Gln) amidotransferase subunit GatD [Candidatus Methanomethylicia archaeon]
MEGLSNYSDFIIKKLLNVNIKIGDEIRIIDGLNVYEGILMPRPILGDNNSIVLKLRNGYNIGVRIHENIIIEKIDEYGISMKTEVYKEARGIGKPRVYIIGTGGTIASRVDYLTGAVYPALTPEELYELIPELGEIAFLEMESLFNIFSEDMTPDKWKKIAEKTYEKIMEGWDGIIIPHGTDTMGYTAAALSFAIRNPPIPIVLTGAQRSSDRPSSDANLNMICSAIVASKAPFAEVTVVMHSTSNDDTCTAHKGTKVRKCHTSRRDTFKTINAKPLATVKPNGEIIMHTKEYRSRGFHDNVILEAEFDPKVVLLKVYPGISEEIMHSIIDLGYHGIVLEGTGLGHVPQTIIEVIKRAIEEEIPVVMTSQCLWGRVNMNVYRRGVELLKIGVIPGEDMLPETALVKLMWTLAKTRNMNEIREIMMNNIAGEINLKSAYEG